MLNVALMDSNYNKFYHIIVLLVILFINIACEDSHNDTVAYTPTLVDADPILKDDSEYIIVIGDTQVYTGTPDYYPFYASTMDWIWSQVKHGKKIKCMLQCGDITETNQPEQYDVFFKMTSPAAELIPCIACIGNHDYDWTENSKIEDRSSSLFSQYTSFQSTKSKIVAQFEQGKMENIIVNNMIQGQRYDIIALEFGPRPEVVQWVHNHIQNNKNIKYILLTHEYLDSNGYLISTNSTAELQFEDRPHTIPSQLWHQLIKDNDNIDVVLCGHNDFSRHLYLQNSNGRDVIQILFNLQYQPNGGDGWVQIWEFPKNSEYVNVDTYNTITREFHPQLHHSFLFKYKY